MAMAVSVDRGKSSAELVPARMLNEFAYCPRLCYLEWVQARLLGRHVLGELSRYPAFTTR